MDRVNLDIFKAAWQEEAELNKNRLSEYDIKKFMRSRSRGLARYYRNGIRFDIALKLLLSLGFLHLSYLYSFSLNSLVYSLLNFSLCVVSGSAQYIYLSRVPGSAAGEETLRFRLERLAGYHYSSYRKSLLISSLSGVFVFLAGSMYYFYFTYGNVPTLEWDDFLVFGLIIAISYAFSSYIFTWQAAFNISQVEKLLEEIRLNSLEAEFVQEQNRKRNRLFLIGIIAFIAGILFLAFLLLS